MGESKAKKIVFIVGPTGIGKSEIALHLAEKINGEIISCDSMQIYKEINIVSNKPSPEDLKRVPHHLINVTSIEEEFDVVQFRQLAVSVIEDIEKRNRIPIAVGGSGLYVEILLDGIFEGGRKDAQLRESLKDRAAKEGIPALHKELKLKDPAAAEKIHPNDLKRIIRALEVLQVEGRPISMKQKERDGLWGHYDVSLFGLTRDRDKLYERVNQRVEEMFERGLVEEIKNLAGANWSPTASKLIGVKEVLGSINGEYGLERAKELIKINTRHFVKRQFTWFRKDKRIEWINLDENKNLEDIVNRIKGKI